MSFLSASIEATEKLIETKDTLSEVIDLVLLCFIKGFGRENKDVVKLYLSRSFIKFCKESLDLDLHFAIKSIMGDK